MTAPDVPLRFELSFEVPGTPEQVWHAIATADGMSAWFLPTDVDEREGGAVCFHMGDDSSSEGTITRWEPPRRIVYEEPAWAALSGHEDAPVTPLATEFLVEATSGGTCVVRIVSSAFGSGAEWEREFFEEMERGWRPFFDHLRLYLTHFPGQTASPMEIFGAAGQGSASAVRAAMRRELGAGEVGEPVEARGIKGRVEQLAEDALLIRITDPVPGYMGFFAHDNEDGTAWPQIAGYFFSDGAAAYVEQERAAWKSWAESLDLEPVKGR